MLLPKRHEYCHQAGRGGVKFLFSRVAVRRIGGKLALYIADNARDIDYQVVEPPLINTQKARGASRLATQWSRIIS